jgi:ParB family transcriptional regulator, chromosome partitioning protein
MSKKEAMGKGIRALLQNIEEETPITRINESSSDSIINTVSLVPLEQIEVNPFQPRTEFKEEALRDLADSIGVHGVIQPVTLRYVSPKKYQLIAGERRLRASKLAGLKSIPAYVRTANDQESLEIALIENIQREDLNAMEIAINYQRLIDECTLTHESLAKRIGKDRSTITNYLRLLKLPVEIQQAIKDQAISMGHARAIISIPDVEKQLYIFDEITSKSLSVRKTEELVRLLNTGTSKPQVKKSKVNIGLTSAHKAVQNKLTDFFDTKVKMKPSTKTPGKGDIIIPYYSNDDLNRILDLLEND